MPRAVDRTQLEPVNDPNRSGTEFHMQALIAPQTEIWTAILQQAAESMKTAVIDAVMAFTGIDLSSLEAFLGSFGDVLLGGGLPVDDFAGVLVSLLTGLIPGATDLLGLLEDVVLGGGAAEDTGFPYTFPLQFGGDVNPVGVFFTNLRGFFDFADFANSGFDVDDAWAAFLDATPLGALIGGVQTNFQQLINLSWQALVNDDEGAIDRTAYELAEALKNIPALNVAGVGAATLVDTFTDVFDNFWSGIARLTGSGKSVADVANAATQLANTADNAEQLGSWNNAILGIRNNKSLMSGIDETEEANYPLDSLYAAGSTEPQSTISVTATSQPMGFWRATEDAKKGFISWLGKGFTNVTGLYIDVYRFDYTTNTLHLVHTSPNQVGQATANWTYIVYPIATVASRIDVAHGDCLAVAWRVTGTGTHSIAGKPIPVPAHPTSVPARLGAVRTDAATTDVSFAGLSALYSGTVPWFGIGIVDGDVPPPYNAPRQTQYSAPGTYTYAIPDWAVYLDTVLIGGGGGGCGGNPVFGFGGEGGYTGTWQGETLVRGVDFPANATQLTITVGAPGARGPTNTPGGAGGDTTRAAISGGKAALTAAGGAAGDEQAAGHYDGDNAGTFTFNGTTYVGGNGGTSQVASPGQDGTAPGAGGGGGSGGTWAVGWPGGAGARGGAWITARQT